MTAWIDWRTEPLSEVPEIEILFVGRDENGESCYAANCPMSDCLWAETSSDVMNLEREVETHKDWHEDGMPQ